MPTTLSIKNAPDDVVERLKLRAKQHHRSLQGEMLTILEDAVKQPKKLSVEEVVAEIRRIGLKTPSEAAEIIRRDRDSR